MLRFRLPDIGEGVAEGEIVAWHVEQGQQVREDDPMVEVMTDKATVTIGAPCDGEVSSILVPVGGVAKVGEVILTLASRDSAPVPKSHSSPGAMAVGDLQDTLPGADLIAIGERATSSSTDLIAIGEPAPPPSERSAELTATGEPAASMSAPPGAELIAMGERATSSSTNRNSHALYFREKPLATPATRRLAQEVGVDLRHVRPTGAGGRVTKEDVLRIVPRSAPSTSERSVAAAQIGAGTHGSRPLSASGQFTSAPHVRAGTRTPFVGVRRRIAERMQYAKRTAAHFTFVEECDVSRLVDLRARLQPEAERRGVALNFLPFVIKAVVEALRAHPALNSALDEDRGELVYHDAFHIGVATATEQGLMVPVVRDADRLRLLELASEVRRLADGARQGTLAPDELRGSTFTITSLGKQAGLLATPILNLPEVGILGVHRIKEKPVVRDGRIEIGHIMLLSLSMDHRVVDGHVGAAFAYNVIDLLENPERLFFEFL